MLGLHHRLPRFCLLTRAPWWQNKVEAVGGNLKPPTLISLRVGVTFLWHYLTCKSNKACTPSVHWRILSGYGFLGDSHGGPNSVVRLRLKPGCLPCLRPELYLAFLLAFSEHYGPPHSCGPSSQHGSCSEPLQNILG